MKGRDDEPGAGNDPAPPAGGGDSQSAGSASADAAATPAVAPAPAAPAEAAAPAMAAAPAPEPDPLAQALAKLEALERDKQELRDHLLRVAADFDNHKKRSRKDLQEAQDRGREALLRELLPTIDNLERALAHAGTTELAGSSASLVDGVRLVLRQMFSVLEKFEVRPFNAVGEAFDPQLHGAIQQIETSESPPGMVVQEFQKGYRIGSRLLRPAMVAVAQPPRARAETAGDGEKPPADGGGGNGAGVASS